MKSMFAYLCLGSNDLARSARFYDATLGVLGYSRCDTSAESETSWNGWIGWGLYEKEGAVQDALWVCKPFNGAPATRRATARWSRCGRRPGARSMPSTPPRWRMAELRKALPGLRLLYNPDFYAAYVRDPDGNKLAVVCRGFTSAQAQ